MFVLKIFKYWSIYIKMFVYIYGFWEFELFLEVEVFYYI